MFTFKIFWIFLLKFHLDKQCKVCKNLRSFLFACMLSPFSHVWLSTTLWTITHQAPLSLRFSRQEYYKESIAKQCFWHLPDPETELNQKVRGFPGGASGKEPTYQCRIHGFSLWVWKMPETLVRGFFTTSTTWEAPYLLIQFSSVAQSCLLFATPRIASYQAPLSITISRSLLKFMSINSVMPSSHLILCRPLLLLAQSLPASGSLPMSQLFTWGGQCIAVSASASVLPMNTQDWSPLGWTGWISLQSKGLPKVFSNTTVQKHQFFGAQLSSQSNSHIHTWLLEKP